MIRSKTDIEKLSRQDLLKSQLCELDLSVKSSFVQPLITQLYGEIAQKGIRFKPHVWVSTSWFCPYGIPGFAIPFYLLHPRLLRLEKEFVGEVEGGTPSWCLQLLRHETGHAIDNAFHLRKSKSRQELFGLSGETYPKKYAPHPQSTNFVLHLDNHYAQAHPDEDWAETFAVWLNPKSQWKKKYEGWPALKKLELVDRLMLSIYKINQLVTNKYTMDELSSCTLTLKDYFDKKKDLQDKQIRIFEQKLASDNQFVRHNPKEPNKIWIYM